MGCDGRGQPLSFVVTGGGNTNDCTRFTTVMEGIRVPRLEPGRPRVRPDHVLGEQGYNSKAIRAWLHRRGIPHTIPERADQIANRARRGSREGRPPAFDHVSVATTPMPPGCTPDSCRTRPRRRPPGSSVSLR
ncbi:transposase [Streptomyces sp. NPDC051657]|uniref:transposase n=1 Tax=Streptomyces sp. NPDC051657 TaxID=3154749 RepID=UPI0034212903